MLGCFVVGLAIPAGWAWASVILGDRVQIAAPPIHGSGVAFVAFCLCLIPLGILVSSSVDWYLIRPFREGVHGDPVCKHIPDGRASDYANYWITHRMVCEFFVYCALGGGIAVAYAAVDTATDSPVGNGAVALVGLAGVAWVGSQLRNLQYALQYVRLPSPGLGSWVSGTNADGKQIEGFIVDVSIDPGVQVIDRPVGPPDQPKRERDERASQTKPEKPYVALKDFATLTPRPAPRPLCPGSTCEFWLPDCEVGLRLRETSGDGGSDSPTD